MNTVHIHKSFSQLEEYIPKNSGLFVIIDNNLKQSCEYFSKFNTIEIDVCEKTKTLESVERIIGSLLEKGADRNCFILGVGGGITTDLTGFVASIYKRGVRFGFVPTTLLAQVDASIGGKNGVNFQSYKNIIGVINQPEWVYICPDTLRTLPEKEFRAGIAEVLKTFVLFDPEYYRKAADYFAQSKAQQAATPDLLTDIITRCAHYKCAVVERDEFEKGERRLLNLGHTFGHAVEKLCGDGAGGIMHGEAVSIGMVIAARIAEKLYPEIAEKGFASQLQSDLEKTGLPVALPAGIKMKKLVMAITKDKKVDGKGIHFILPKGLAEVEDRDIPLEQLEEIANDLC